MHICFLSHEYPELNKPHGGIGTFLKIMGQELTKRNHKVTVIGWHKGANLVKETDGAVQIIRTPYPSIPGFRWVQNIRNISKQLRALHSETPIDILEGQEGAFAFLPRLKGVKRVIRLHGGHHFFSTFEQRKINKWKAFLEKKSFANTDGFIGVSQHVKEVTFQYFPIIRKPIEIINYPIDTEKFYASDPSKAVPFKLLFAGTICEKKGVRQLLEAVSKIKPSFPELYLELYGRDWNYKDGRSYTEEMKAQPFYNEKYMHFKGAVSHDQLPSLYESAALCVFPSHGETQGLVAPEAMCMEKVVVFSEIGPGPETITHGETGFLCNPHDADSIASIIKEYLEHQDKYTEMGVKARKFVLGKFHPNIIIDKNISFYKSLIASL